MGELEILIRGIDSPYSQDPKTPKNHQHKHQNFGIRGVPGDPPVAYQSEGVVARTEYGFPACEWWVGWALQTGFFFFFFFFLSSFFPDR